MADTFIDPDQKSEEKRVSFSVPAHKAEAATQRMKEFMGMGLTSEEALLAAKEEFEETPFIAPDKEEVPSGVLSTLKRTGQAVYAGVIDTAEQGLRNLRLPGRIAGAPSSTLDRAVQATGEYGEAVAPEEPGYWEKAIRSTIPSLPPALAMLLKGRTPRRAVGIMTWKGATFGIAEADKFLDDIRTKALLEGASADELEKIERSNIPKALLEGSFEMTGEIGSDLMSGWIFGILKNPGISEQVKKGIKSYLKDYVTKTSKSLAPEVMGELFTEYGEHEVRKSAGLVTGDPQLLETGIVTAIQTALTGFIFTAAGRQALRNNLNRVASEMADKHGIDQEKAKEIITNQITEAEKLAAAYKSGKEKIKDGIESLDKKIEETKAGKKKKGKPVPPEMPESKRKEMMEDAESVREYEKQLYEGGPERGPGPGEGGENIQRQQEQGREGVQPEAPKQAGEEGGEAQRKEQVVESSNVLSFDQAPGEKGLMPGTVRPKPYVVPTTKEEPPKSLPETSLATPVQQTEEALPLVQISNKPIEYIPKEQYETFELSKGYTLRKLGEKIIFGNAASRRAAYRKANDAIDKGIVTPMALSDVAGNFFPTIDMEDAQKAMKDGKLDDAGALLRIEKLQKLLQEFSEKIGIALAGKGAAEPTMQEQPLSPKEKVKRINEAISDIKKDKTLYKSIKDRLHEGDKVEDVATYYRADFENYLLDDEQMPKVIEAIGLKEKILSPIDVLFGRTIDEELDIGKQYDKDSDRLMKEGKTEEEIEAFLQEKYGALPGTEEPGIQESGSQVLEDIENDIPQREETKEEKIDRENKIIKGKYPDAVYAFDDKKKKWGWQLYGKPLNVSKLLRKSEEKKETKRETIVRKIKAQQPETKPEVKPEPAPTAAPTKLVVRGLSSHPLYMSPEEAATQAALLQKRVKPDSPIETRIKALQAHINNTYHTGGDIEALADQLNRTIASLEVQKNKPYGEKNMSIMQIDEALRDLGQLASLISHMNRKQERSLAYMQVTTPEIAVAQLEEVTNIINDRRVNGRIATAADIVEILRRDPTYGKLLDLVYGDKLMEKLQEIPIHLGTSRNYPGSYNLHNHFIHINPTCVYQENIDTRHTLGHEVMHAVTSRELETNEEFRATIRNIMTEARSNLSPEYQRIIRLMDSFGFEDILEDAAKNGDIAYEDQSMIYGFASEDEFIAVALSDKNLRDMLELTPAIPTKRSLWRRFVDAIRKYVFGQDIDPSLSDQVFDAVVKHGGQVDTEAYREAEEAADLSTQRPQTNPIFQDLQKFANRVRSRDNRTTRTIYNLEHAPLKGSGIHAGIVAGEGAINIENRVPDAPYISTLFWSPVRVAEKYRAKANNPIPAKVASGIVHGVDLSRYETANGLFEVERIKEGLKKDERRELTADMKEIEMGEHPKMKPKLAERAQRIKELFDSIRERYKESRRMLFFESLYPGEQEILNNVFNGKDASEATFEYNRKAREYNKTQKAAGSNERMASYSYEVIKSHLAYLEELDKWGWQDYITHAMKGSIAIVDERGNVVSVAQTTHQAIERAKEYIEARPSADHVTIKYDHWVQKDSPVKLSKKQAQYLQGIVARAINKEVKEIQAGVNVHIAKRALGKVVSIKPGYVFAPYVQERKDVLPGEEDIFDILPAYVYQMNKKIALDQVIQYWTNNRSKVDQANLRTMIDKQIDAAKGKYWIEDKIVDDSLRWLGLKVSEAAEKVGINYHPGWGEKGFAASRAISTLTGTEAWMKFGYRPMAGLLNRMSGFGHTWVKTGLPYIIEARRFLKTEQGQEFLQNHAADLGTSLVEEVGGKIRTKVAKAHPTYLFQAAEKPNREESYVASYLWARDKLDMGAEEAREFARRSVWLQQFNYNIAAIPEIFRSPIGRAIFQFKTYLMNELSFIASLKGPKEWSKYLTMQFVLGGPKGMLMTLKSLPVIGAINGVIQAIRGGADWFEELEQYANTLIPRLWRGGWGFFGIDASMPASFQFPTDWSDLIGVIGSDITKLMRDFVTPYTKGEHFTKWSMLEGVKGTVPIAKYWTDLLLAFDKLPGFPGRDGEIWDSRGKFMYKLNTADFIKMFGGATPLQYSIKQTSNRIEANMREKDVAQVASIIEHAVKHRRHITGEFVDGLIDTMAPYFMKREVLLQAIKRAEIPPEMRNVLDARANRKLDALEEQARVNAAMHKLGYY